jgi:hypothetical protein
MKDPLISDECRALFDLLNIGILILRKDFSPNFATIERRRLRIP